VTDQVTTARVTAGFGRHFLVEDTSGVGRVATRRGKRSDIIVGDQVQLTLDASGQAVIEAALPRASVLMRAEGTREKTLAANIDQVAIVFAARPAFNPHFVWRALLAAHGAGIDALAILNKNDLPELDGARAFLAQLEKLGETTLAVSAKAGAEDTKQALPRFLRDRNTLLVGQSGMGKSTLLNLLVPDAGARTQEFSTRLNLGKQTTSSSRWFRLPGGGALVDSPGFQSFGLRHLDERALAAAMPDFARAAGQCRFLDCRHLDEPDCAVRAALERREIDHARYSFYRQLMTELRE
jgi:ribosome biogenesis GTPase / thiamine phosphate phosphatase